MNLQRLTKQLDKITRRHGPLGPPTVHLNAPRLGIEFRYGDQDTPFHAASVGKLATATLIAQLVDEGRISPDTPITRLLPTDELRGLFVINGEDYAREVTVEQLATHTSGVADYFEGKAIGSPPLIELALSEPDRFWTPSDLLNFSRDRQRPFARPGARFHYSDTGYILLGRIIEELQGTDFHDEVHRRIFTPLDMQNSFFAFRTRPASGHSTMQPLWLGTTDISTFTSVSCDWSGGGIAFTADDLATFTRALFAGNLVSPASRDWMTEQRNRFRLGLRYGAGTMEVRFGEFFFPFRSLPRLVGHIGILAAHAFYDPVHDTTVVLNFGSTKQMGTSFRVLTMIEQHLARS